MSSPLHDEIIKVHSLLCPPGAFGVHCIAVDGRVQLRPDGPERYLNCSVEVDCRARMTPGCAKLAHGVMPTPEAPGAMQTAHGISPSKAAEDGSDDLIYD